MIDLVSNLHSSIRKYCIERRLFWAVKYDEIQAAGRSRKGRGYSDEALLTFPRYLILDAIREQFERYRPEEFAGLEEAKEFFKAVANETSLDESFSDGLEKQAIQEERALIDQFIEEQTPSSLINVAPLFYRRVMSEIEENAIRERLKERWGIEPGYWFPLSDDRPDDVEAFQDKHFESEVGTEKLVSLLQARGVTRVWEIGEGNRRYEVDVSHIEPYYFYGGGEECFWGDDSFDWIIYASHEGSITIGGWLLAAIKAEWTNWSERVWTSYDFD
jgi:hypothetical protein